MSTLQSERKTGCATFAATRENSKLRESWIQLHEDEAVGCRHETKHKKKKLATEHSPRHPEKFQDSITSQHENVREASI